MSIICVSWQRRVCMSMMVWWWRYKRWRVEICIHMKRLFTQTRPSHLGFTLICATCRWVWSQCVYDDWNRVFVGPCVVGLSPEKKKHGRCSWDTWPLWTCSDEKCAVYLLLSISSFGPIIMTLRDCGQVPGPKCKSSSVFCRQSSAAGHVIGVHPLWRQMRASLVSVLVWKSAKKGVCENHERSSERARLRKCHSDSPGARTTFLDHFELGFDSREDLIDLIENDDATAEMMLVAIDNFP